MQNNRPSSNSSNKSRLIQLFVQRGGIEGATTGEQTISALIAHQRRRQRGLHTAKQRMQVFLRSRNIYSVEPIRDFHCDGALEPLGQTYREGFRILLKKQINCERARFTVAHEICHTYFYELVPELKFVSQETDPFEERICDFGAAELLMPEPSVRKSAAALTVCLESLNRLATEYSVSLTAMFLRLRSLRLWTSVLSDWHRMVNGKFVVANFYGGRSRPWQWDDESILISAWSSNRAAFGSSFIRYVDDNGVRYCSPVRFEVRRFGERMLALWGSEISPPTRNYPLLDSDSLTKGQ